jgi:hypothetical protein
MSRRFDPANKTNPQALLKHARYLLRREWRKWTTTLRFLVFYTLRGRRVPRIIFLHLPKTGGISIAIYILRRIGWQRSGRSIHVAQMPWHGPITETVIAKANRALFIYGHMPFDVVDRLDHTRTNYVVTFLREPRSRLWSLYRHLSSFLERFPITPEHPAHGVMMRCAGLSAEAFFASDDPLILSTIDNHMVRQLAGHMADYPVSEAEWPSLLDKAKVNLARIHFIGLMETYEEDFRGLIHAIKFAQPRKVPYQNRGASRFGPRPAGGERPEVEQTIDRLTRWDRELYDYAVALREHAGADHLQSNRFRSRSAISAVARSSSVGV